MIGHILGIMFFFILFSLGMRFSHQNSIFFVLGIIGFVGTVYFIVRIVSAILTEMKRKNTE